MNKKVERVMAFDWGLKNIGVAVGTRALGTSQPCAVIKAKDGSPNWAEVEALIGTWNPALLVVGDPLNMDGSDAEITPRARRFARQLEGRFGLTVVMVACDARGNVDPADLEAKAAAHFVTRAKGGNGCVREVVELLLKAQGKWATVVAANAK